MAVTVTLAGVDHTGDIDQRGLQVQQILGAQRDTATLIYKKYGSKSYTPTVLDTVLIQDGAITGSSAEAGYGYGMGYYGLGYGNGYQTSSKSDAVNVFGGRIAVIKETPLTEASGIIYELDCVDYGID